jgi:hypothetical protein
MSNFISLEQISKERLSKILEQNPDSVGMHIMYTIHENPTKKELKHAIYVGKDSEDSKHMFIRHTSNWKDPSRTVIKKQDLSKLFYPEVYIIYLVKYKMVDPEASKLACKRAYEALETYDRICHEYSEMFEKVWEDHKKGHDTGELEKVMSVRCEEFTKYSNSFGNSLIFAFYCWTGTILNVTNDMMLKLTP